VYAKTGATWAEQQELTASDGASGDFFALGMDFDGESVIAGEPATNSLTPQPAAYIFVKSGSGFVQQAKLDIDKTGVSVGSAVAISGDTAVVGTPALVGFAGSSRATIYARANGAWAVQQTLTMPSEDLFGGLVRIQGDAVYVSAETGGQSSVYVFKRTGQVWAQSQQLSAPAAMFGPSALAVYGGTLAVGSTGNKLTGAVQVFRDPAEDAAVSSSSGDKKSSGCSFAVAPSSAHSTPWALLGCALTLTLTLRKRKAR